MEYKRRRIWFLTGLLLLVFCALFLPLSAAAEEIEGTYTYITSGVEKEKRQKENTFYYRDSFFDCSSYELNMELASFSIRLAVAGFGIGETSEPLNLLPFFDKLGVKYSDETVHYGKPTADTIGFAYGIREVSETECVVLVVVRGGNYKDEWASNFTLGNGIDHEGFRAAADKVSGEVSEYLLKIPSEKKVSVLLTGYSRGAAVANLAAADLDFLSEAGELGNIRPENIYAYCFECPMNSKAPDDSEKSKVCNNIFSFVNEIDAVTKVAPGRWGYRRYGVTLFFPSPQNCSEYEALEGPMLEKYFAYSDASKYTIETGQSVFLDHSVYRIVNLVGSPDNYVKYFQDMIRSVVLGEKVTGNAMSALVMPVVSEYLDNMKKQEPGESDVMNFGIAHAPELCMAWLDTLGDGSVLLTCKTSYLYMVFDGVADVSVYDSDGNLLLTGDGKNITYVTDSAVGGAYGISDEFLLSCPVSETLYVAFAAGKKNRVNVISAVYDMQNCRDVSKYEYQKVLMKKGSGAVFVLREDSPEFLLCEGDSLTATLESVRKGEDTGITPVTPNGVSKGKTADPSEVTIAATPTPTPTPTLTPTPVPTATEVPASGKKTGEEKSFLRRPGGIVFCILSVLIAAALVVLLVVRKRQRKES